MEDSKIQWCSHTFNPWRGCTKVSPGCAHCYAEQQSKRNPKVLGIWGDQGTRVIASESYWRQPVKWNRDAEQAGERRRVFCLSLGDIFEDRPELAGARRRLGPLIENTPHLDWLLLTKRPENWKQCCADMWWRPDPSYPLPANVWLGVSVEDQQRADERIPHLLQIPARVRFLSCEPLLGPLELTDSAICGRLGGYLPFLDWVIVGGESGHQARPFLLDWARSLRDQCQAANVTFFLKQIGSAPRYLTGTGVAGVIVPEDKKGGDPEEWPADLRIRDFPRR